MNVYMPRGAWILGALGAVVLAAAALWMHQPREPVASKALLEEILAEGVAHPVGSPEGELVAGRVAKALAEAGVPVELHRTKVAGRHGGPVDLINVMGRLKGRGEGPATLLTAHHDSVRSGPGAGDDGAGVVSIIEIARILAKEGTERDVIILISDGEEAGLLGAIAFAMEHEWFDDVGAVVNLDARGASGPCHVYEVGFGQRALVDILAASLPRPVASSFADEVYRRMPNGTDFHVYRRLGLPGFNLGFIGSPEVYHQPTDVPENLHPGTLAHMQESALALVRALDRAAPLPNGKPPNLMEWRSRLSIGDPTALREIYKADMGAAPEPTAQSFASFAQRWVLAFDAGLAPYLAGAVAFVTLLALAIAWWRGLLGCGAWWGALVRFLFVIVVSAGGAALAAWGIWLYGATVGTGWLRSGSYLGPELWWPWVTAIWSVAFAIGCTIWQLFSARSAWGNVSAAAIILLALFGTASVMMPGAAALLLPISAATAVALLLASLMPARAGRFAAAFAGSIQLWALTAVLIPVEPSLLDAFLFPPDADAFKVSFVIGAIVLRPVLCVVAFVALLPGTRPIVLARSTREPDRDRPMPAAAPPATASSSRSEWAPLPLDVPSGPAA